MPRTDKSKQTKYLDQTFGLKDPLLKKIQKAVESEGVKRMQISAHEARILQFLVKVSKAKKVIEIGTLYAYSSFHIAKALPHDGKIWTIDHNKNRHRLSKKILKNSPDFKKISWHEGSALEQLKVLESFAPFDMIFIDADKEPYLKYLDWAEKHLKKTGLLVADNTFLFGGVYGESDRDLKVETIKTMQKFNIRLSNSKLWKGALLPTKEGMTVSIKQF
ncbi:MAG: O-methyltransferase [Bdellovibrionaceae bacterium]|nr:O-methyltransferase [Pseudobdellovibrionaceae bacterium]